MLRILWVKVLESPSFPLLSNCNVRELTIRQGLAPRRQTWQRVDWIEYFVFRANFDRYERAHTVRTSLAGTS